MGGMCDSEKVVHQPTIFLMENCKDGRVYIKSQLEIGNRRSTIIDFLFTTLQSKTKQHYRGSFRVWEMGA